MIRRRLGKLPLGLEAAVELTVASLFIARRPGHEITELLGAPQASAGPEAQPSAASWPPGPGAEPAAEVGRAVARVAAVLPWRPLCLPQTIAARRMLKRRRIASRGHLGVVATAPLSTHAWVTVGADVVQGGPVSHVSEFCFFD